MKFIRFAAVVLLALSLGVFIGANVRQQPGQSTFVSVEDAGHAFFSAMQSPDDRFLMSILGPAGKDIVSSGDPAEDLDARTRFTGKYQEMHRFVTDSDGKVTLVVGPKTGRYRFRWSTKAGLGISIPWLGRTKSCFAALARMSWRRSKPAAN